MQTQRITGTGYDREDSYFHQRDQALLAKKRAQLDAARAASASATTCPRCSAAMSEVALEHVKVDHCIGCGGVFLDKGGLELLTHVKSGGLFRRLVAE